MKFEDLLNVVNGAPVFDAALLRVGQVESRAVSRQLSRWVSAGKIHSLRRGVYALAEPFRRRPPEGFEVANLMVRPSYVSLESALSFHGLIPEAVFTVTSVTSARPALYRTPLGDYDYRHISTRMFWGYAVTPLGTGSTAIVASPEKALIDLVYLRSHGDDPAFLRQLRLSRLERLDLNKLADMARKVGKPKLERAMQVVAEMAREQAAEYEEL